MNKLAKGAVGAGTAAVLLLGGAGSLAYWSDSHNIGGDDITSGHLSMTATTENPGWVYAEGNAKAGQPVTTIVPGDKIVSTYSYTIHASGDNLTGTLSAPTTVTPTFTGNDATSIRMPVTVKYDVGGQPVPSTITSANDGDVVNATVEVDFPYGDPDVNSNDTQDVTASLNNIAITLQQSENTGA